MVLFLALSTRIIPSVLRIQTAFLEINGAKGAALDLLQDLAKLPATESIISAQSSHHVSFVEKEKAGNAFQASVLLRNVFADYGNQELFELKNINFEIQPGELLAIVGPSGGGKTSIVDVIVGAISVRSGEVLISNSPPEIAIGKWPTEIRYVSQDVYLLAGTLASNILWPNLNASFSEDALWNILEKLNLADWARSLPKGLYSNIETFGNNISGGQKQRIGIARALYSNPHLLIMDEATSSLDSTTERDISENVVRDLSGVTRIVIAHRLSTIRHADKILYIANGSIVHSGSFEQVRAAVPAFDIQAEISGI
jgi:ABC-type multidrug transport system fused ATPase/permease subunit